MKNSFIFLFAVGAITYAAQLGTLTRTSDVVIQTELAAYAVDPTTITDRLDAIESILDGGITTNLSNLVIVDGVVTGTY